jgi:hypothetical protein
MPEILKHEADPVKPAYEWMSGISSAFNMPPVEYCYAAVLLIESDPDDSLGFVKKYRLDQHYIALAEALPGLKEFERSIADPSAKDSNLVFRLEKIPSAYWVALAAITGDGSNVRKFIEKYLSRLINAKPLITGHDLKMAGFMPGPGFGDVLEKIRRDRINGAEFTREEEMEIAKNMLGD